MRSITRAMVVLSAGLTALATAWPAEASFSAAKRRGKAGFCSKFGPKTIKKTKYGRAFLHAWDKTCWSCPAGFKRTVNPNVRAKNACQKAGRIGFARAKKHRKVKFLGKCPRGQFLHVLNQTCYSCPKGYRRSPDPRVGGKKACVKRTKDRWARGRYRGKPSRFCAKGSFFDPRKGGECWSCPKGWHRTINPVTSGKACSKNLLGVLSVDTGLCRNVVGALRKGAKGVDELRSKVDAVIKPIVRPVGRAMKKLMPRINSPKEVDRFLRDLARSMKPFSPVVDEVTRVGRIMDASPGRFSKILLNPSLICSGDKRRINQALRRAGLNPDFQARQAGLFDGLLIPNAYAAGGTTFHVVSVSASTIAPKIHSGTSLTLSIVTNFGRYFGIFLSSPATVVGAVPGSDVSMGYMLFPKASWDEFTGINQLGIEVGFSAGDAVKQLMDKLGNRKLLQAVLKGALNAGYAVSFDPGFIDKPAENVPGFGVQGPIRWSVKKSKVNPNNQNGDDGGGVDGGSDGARGRNGNRLGRVVELTVSVDYTHQLR